MLEQTITLDEYNVELSKLIRFRLHKCYFDKDGLLTYTFFNSKLFSKYDKDIAGYLTNICDVNKGK